MMSMDEKKQIQLDRMRFTKSDRERGYVANSVWTVTAATSWPTRIS